MSRTVTAMFDSRSDADAAKSRLTASHVDAQNIHIVDQGSVGGDHRSAGADDRGWWQSLKDMFVSDEDRHTYAEGINRGGYLLSASVDDNQADAAVRILDESNSVDLDQRSSDWRKSGWNGEYATSDAARPTRAGEAVDEQTIPVVFEEMRVGKREVARGGARVRSYIRETPVNEQVSLREEHVSVERRPVDRVLGAGEIDGDLLRERTIEMTETAEEAVIDKQARVVEEIVVRKTADNRVENVSDSVRHTEVEVDDGVRSAGVGRNERGATGTAPTAGTAGRVGSAGTVATGIDGTPGDGTRKTTADGIGDLEPAGDRRY